MTFGRQGAQGGARRRTVPALDGGASSPTLPSNRTAGVPAWRMLDIGPQVMAYAGTGYADEWWDKGHGGFGITWDYFTGFGGSANWKPSDSSADGGSYQMQQYQEPAGHDYAAQVRAAGMENGFGLRFTSNVGTSYPPYGDWFNDSTWTTVNSKFLNIVQTADYLGYSFIYLDFEYSSWSSSSYTGNTHTEAENHAKARQRGYEIGQTIWNESPNMRVVVYDCPIAGDYGDLVYFVGHGGSYPHADSSNTCRDWLEGMFDGMKDAAADGEILLIEYHFYRYAYQNLSSGALDQSGYKANSQGTRSFLSSFFDQDVWDYASSRLRLAAYTWHETDVTTFYTNTKPNDTQWSEQVGWARQYSEGSRRAEFFLSSGPWDFADYSTGTSVAGALAAASQTAISTTGPTIETAAAASVSAGNVTVTVSARDDYGVACVRVYSGATFSAANPEASYLGSMQMVWDQGDGSMFDTYTTDVQDCTFTSTNGGHSAGEWVVLGVFGIRADEFSGLSGETTWVKVQAT